MHTDSVSCQSSHGCAPVLRIVQFLILIWLSVCLSPVPGQGGDAGLDTLYADGFNGLDYYSGRMIRGFGAHFDQYIEEKTEGRQTFESIPALYYYLNPHAAFRFSHNISLRKMGTDEDLVYQTDPVSNTTFVEGQIRPVKGLQFFPSLEIWNRRSKYNSHFMGDRYEEDNQKRQNFALQGIFLSGSGVLRPVDASLKWMHYTETADPMLRHGQVMMNFHLQLLNSRKDGYARILSDDVSPLAVISGETENEYNTDIRIRYGVTDVINLWLNIENLFLDNTWQNLETDTRGGLESTDFQIISGVDWITGPDFFSRLEAEYFIKDGRETSPEYNFRDMSGRRIAGKYAIHWLPASSGPSRALFLANARGLFGNRLRGGKWGFSYALDLRTELFESRRDDDIDIPSRLTRHLKLNDRMFRNELQIRYGISDHFETGFISHYEYGSMKDNSPAAGPDAAASDGLDEPLNRGEWENSFQLRFGSYTYNRMLESRYGWARLTSFDQYYDPILAPLMVSAEVYAGHISIEKTNDDFLRFLISEDLGALTNWILRPVNNNCWRYTAGLRLGLWRNWELNWHGEWFVYSSGLRNAGDPEWQMRWILNWQPWQSLRVAFIHDAQRYADSVFAWPQEPPYSVYIVDNRIFRSWNIRIMMFF